MNSRVDGNNINSESAANALMGQIKFSGLTPLGTALQQKIMEPLVLGPARAGRLQKPVLIIAVTDGAPGGEDRFTVVKVIKAANQELARTRYGSDAVSFQFAQVGNDMGARKFLEEIDKHVSSDRRPLEAAPRRSKKLSASAADAHLLHYSPRLEDLSTQLPTTRTRLTTVSCSSSRPLTASSPRRYHPTPFINHRLRSLPRTVLKSNPPYV